jgi:UDP-GlcNAc:undecaprenyl-phosphate GlcNAc-1-phosphate transferase
VNVFQISIALVAALAVSALATPIVSGLARLFHVVDIPNERKVNRREDIPLLGGIAVALGVVVGLAVAVSLMGEKLVEPERLEGYLIGGTLLLVVGAWDDRWGLRATPKLLVEIAAAAIAISYGFEIPHITEPFSRTTFVLPEVASWIATVAWIVAVTNAMNLIDGLDGLSAGLGAIIAATLVLICWEAGQMAGVIFGAVLVGSLLGFLPYNFPPARIFIGDTGALFLGYSLSLLALQAYRQTALLTFVVPLLALAVPLLDTGLSIVRRLRAHKPIFHADKLHMHHRLLESSGSDRSAVLSLYFLTACFCIIAVSFVRLQGYAAIVFLGAVVILTVRLLRNLGAFAEGDDPPERPEPPPVEGRLGDEPR